MERKVVADDCPIAESILPRTDQIGACVAGLIEDGIAFGILAPVHVAIVEINLPLAGRRRVELRRGWHDHCRRIGDRIAAAVRYGRDPGNATIRSDGSPGPGPATGSAQQTNLKLCPRLVARAATEHRIRPDLADKGAGGHNIGLDDRRIQVGGHGFERDEATAGAQRGIEGIPVSQGAQRVAADHHGLPGHCVEDINHGTSARVLLHQVGRCGVEGDIAPVGTDVRIKTIGVGLHAGYGAAGQVHFAGVAQLEENLVAGCGELRRNGRGSLSGRHEQVTGP